MLKQVLLVDDDDVTLMICKLRLKKSNFCEEVTTGENGEDAVQFIEEQIALPTGQRQLPELIFLDLNMPIMDGWTFLEIFESKYLEMMPNTKIAILSSSVDPLDEERAATHPCVMGFINKPLTEMNLKSLMESDLYKKFYP